MWGLRAHVGIDGGGLPAIGKRDEPALQHLAVQTDDLFIFQPNTVFVFQRAEDALQLVDDLGSGGGQEFPGGQGRLNGPSLRLKTKWLRGWFWRHCYHMSK